jgi:hypothetical protein
MKKMQENVDFEMYVFFCLLCNMPDLILLVALT